MSNDPFDPEAEWVVDPSEAVLNNSMKITAENIEIMDSSCPGDWIVVRLGSDIGAVYQSAHLLEIGMTFDIDEDAWAESLGQEEDAELPPVRVLMPDGTFYGILRWHNQNYHQSTGLFSYIFKDNSIRTIDEVTTVGARTVDNDNVEDLNESCGVCIYRPFSLMFAEVALHDAERAADANRATAAKKQLTEEVEAVLAGNRDGKKLRP